MTAATPAQRTATSPTTSPPASGGPPNRLHRSTGRIIGALFLAGFFTYGTGGVLTTSILDTGDVIGSVSAQQTAFALGALLMLTVAAVEIGKAVLFFPLLGRPGRRTALAYLAGMIVEVTLMAVGVVALLSLVPLGEQVQSGATSAALGQSLGTLMVDLNDLAYQSGQAAAAVGAFCLSVFLYSTRMIPPALAMWGAIGYALHLTGAVAELSGLHISMFLLIPGGLFELTFAIWLLLRGIRGTDNWNPTGS
jgi:hypothetical protein